MSINTLITLFKKSSNLDLNALHVKKNYYYGQISTWIVVALDGEEKDQKMMSKLLSGTKKVDTIFLSVNDYYWEAICFRDGNQFSLLKLDFENNKNSKYVDIDSLIAFAEIPELAKDLERLINQMKQKERVPSSIQVEFELAFNLTSIEGMIYDKIFTSEDAFQYEYNLTHVENQIVIKPLNTIIKTLDIPFNKRGYKYEAGYQEANWKVAFRKNMNGFWYTIIFDIGKKNNVEIKYVVPYGIGWWATFTYSSVFELRTRLLTVWREVIEKEISSFELNPIQAFNPENIYREIVDPFMVIHEYKRTNIQSDLLHRNGDVEYKHVATGDIITFQHFSLMVDLKITRNGLPHNAGSLVSSNKKIFDFRIPEVFGFRNEKEFRLQIEHLLNILQICFETSLK